MVPLHTVAQVSPPDSIVYQCWFDENHNALQSGYVGNGLITLDVSALTEGFHTLNVQFGTDTSAQIQRHIFYRIPTTSEPTLATSYSCWFDEDYSTLQTGNIGNGIIMLNVDSLSEGFHSVNIQYGTGKRAQLGRHFFYKVPLASDPTIATTYNCWFDEDYSTLQTGSIGNGIIMLDVTGLEDGFHSVNVQYGTGSRAQLGRTLFYKVPTAVVDQGPIVYHCWFDENYSTLQSDTLGSNGIIVLDASQLPDSNHTLYVQFGDGPRAQLTSHIFWKRTAHQISITTTGNGTISIPYTSDTLLNGNFVFDSTVITITANPTNGHILRYLIVNGDTVYPPYTMTVTGNVQIAASFVPYLPDLHVTQISYTTPVANRTMEVTYTVANHGTAPTPVGAVWYDTVYLVQNADVRLFDPDDHHGLLLSVPNMQGLDTGESYTNTVTVTIPPDMVGSYYLFVFSNQSDATGIDFSPTGGIVPDSYTPSITGIPYPYLTAYIHHQGSMEEIENRDNFFFTRVNVVAPPAADLVVTNITSPSSFYSGTTVNVVATIANQGHYATTSYGWLNACYISHSDQFDSTAVLLTSQYHDALSNAALQVGSSYQETIACSAPLTWYRESYFYVMADASNSEYEYAGEGNNMRRSSLINVILTPPADLVVSNVAVPSTISNRDSFTISYTIQNAGLGTSNVNEWYNQVFISTSPTLPAVRFNAGGYGSGYSYYNIPDAVDWCCPLESNRQFVAGGIAAGASVTTEKLYTLPAFISKATQLYVIVVADVNNNVFEYNREDNNVGHSNATQAEIYFPDFSLSTLSAPDTMVTGHLLDLGFTLHNNGMKNYLGSLGFRIYYSTDSVFAETDATLLTSTSLYASSMMDYPRSLSLQVLFSTTMSDSNYYLFLFVNKDSSVAEYSIQNNMLRSGPHYICHRTLPDLLLCNVTLPDTLQAGGVATLSFDVVNNGESGNGRPANIHGLSCHTALMANDSLWCPVQMQIAPYPIGVMTLAVGDTLHYVQTVTIPPMMRDSISFTLKVDANNKIQELNENNNSVTILRQVLPTPFDLAVQDITLPGSYTTGDTVTISWTTAVAGPASFCYDTTAKTDDATGYSYTKRWNNNTAGILWNEVLALSSDSLYSSDDILITRNSVRSTAANSNTRTVRVVMPHTLSGNIYVVGVADESGRCIELTRENNRLSVPVTATLAPQPNLVVTSFSVDDTITQKQGCKVYYTVTNAGEGNIGNAYWRDVLHVGNAQLGGKSRIMSLAAGESYNDSIEVVMPDNLLGTYAAFVVADEDNNIYELGRESDNYLLHPVTILPAPPCDLVVASVTADAAVTMGDSIHVTWVTQNIGENAIKGMIKDAVYLSANTVYDEGDMLLGELSYYGDLPANGSGQHSMTRVVMNGLMEGNYHVIVRTNVMRAFNEVSFTNNSGRSTAATTITLPTLVIGQEEQFTLTSGNKSYYKLVVGPELAGKSLVVSLKSKAHADSHQTGNNMTSYYSIQTPIINNPNLADIPPFDPFVPITMNVLGRTVTVGYRYCPLCYGGNCCSSPEPRDISVYILIDGHMYSTSISETCYARVFERQTGIIVNDDYFSLNGIYVSHGNVPSISTYDYGTSAPNDTAQHMFIPSLREGTYYFMASGSSSGGALRAYRPYGYSESSTDNDLDFYYILPRTETTQQDMRLLANLVNFEIIDVNSSVGSNTGSTTTRIGGGNFSSVMDFRLVGVNGVVPASAVNVVNPTEAYVTFNLTDVPEGTYNVEAELPGGIITSKEEAFVVGQNLPSQLSVNIVAPAKVRVGQVTEINIDYNNEGASDLNVVGLLVRPSAGTYISPTPNPDTWENGDVFIRFPEVGGPTYDGLMIPWTDQNQAPPIREVAIPTASSTPVSETPSSSSSGPTVIHGGLVYPARAGGGGNSQIYTRPGSSGQGTLDVYPVYKAVAR